jgi:hypothetical protein
MAASLKCSGPVFLNMQQEESHCTTLFFMIRCASEICNSSFPLSSLFVVWTDS